MRYVFLILVSMIGIPSVALATPPAAEVEVLCDEGCGDYSAEGECPVESGASCPEPIAQCHARCMRSDGSLPVGVSSDVGARSCQIEAVWTEYAGGWLTRLYARQVRLVRCGAWYYIGPQNWYRSAGAIASEPVK
jgi:hypothetical protein